MIKKQKKKNLPVEAREELNVKMLLRVGGRTQYRAKNSEPPQRKKHVKEEWKGDGRLPAPSGVSFGNYVSKRVLMVGCVGNTWSQKEPLDGPSSPFFLLARRRVGLYSGLPESSL